MIYNSLKRSGEKNGVAGDTSISKGNSNLNQIGSSAYQSKQGTDWLNSKKFAATSSNFYNPNAASSVNKRSTMNRNLPVQNVNYSDAYQQNTNASDSSNININKMNNGMGNNFGRKTFYVSEYQKQRQHLYNRKTEEDSDQKGRSVDPKKQDFHKPRALSRQADAHIKIEVHRDANIMRHLQTEQMENMNLMFYDFNGSSQHQQ